MKPELGERLDQVLRDWQRTRDKLVEANAQARRAQASVASRDELVTVTVTASAGITALSISDRAMRRYDGRTLADTLRELIGEANIRLQAGITERYRAVLGDGFDPYALSGDPEAVAETIRQTAKQRYGPE